VPRLLARLDVTDQIVTIDARGCQRDIAARIVAGQGDSVLALKVNQPDLLTNVTDTFALATATDAIDRTVEKHHGRFEVRVCETISDLAVLRWLDPASRWPGLRTIAR